MGFRKAEFSYRWGENYHRNFGGPRGGFFGDFFDKDFTEAHGTFGKIIKIDLPIFLIQGNNGVEKVIFVKGDTAIRHLHDTFTKNDLKIDDSVVVIGSPNNSGQIEARFIRLFPALLNSGETQPQNP